MYASVSMIEAALFVALHIMDGEKGYTSTKHLQETSLQVCEAVRRLPGELRNLDCSSRRTWNVERTRTSINSHYTLNTLYKYGP